MEGASSNPAISASVGGKQPGFADRAEAKTTAVISEKFIVSGNIFEVREQPRQ